MKVLYIATSSFPGDSAYSTRIDGICRALQERGIATHVLTDYSNSNTGSFIYHGSKVYVGSKHVFSKRTSLDKVLATTRMERLLRVILEREDFDCVITSSIYMRIGKIIGLVHKHRIPIVLESCEWFEAYNWRKKERSRGYKRFVRAWNNDFTKVDGVIAISRMLEEHYKRYVASVTRIPTILEIPERFMNTYNEFPIRLIFTGSIAWGKDRLIEVIKAIDEIGAEGKIELHIYGPTKEEIISQLGERDILERNLRSVIVHGKIPHDEVEHKCQNSDYGIILRPDRTQSNAGFPTKLAEYLSVGASVIANDTGDIGMYVNNQVNGFLLPTDYSISQLVSLLKDILSMSRDSITNMKKTAYETAVHSFDLHGYSEKLEVFLQEVITNYGA